MQSSNVHCSQPLEKYNCTTSHGGFSAWGGVKKLVMCWSSLVGPRLNSKQYVLALCTALCVIWSEPETPFTRLRILQTNLGCGPLLTAHKSPLQGWKYPPSVCDIWAADFGIKCKCLPCKPLGAIKYKYNKFYRLPKYAHTSMCQRHASEHPWFLSLVHKCFDDVWR